MAESDLLEGRLAAVRVLASGVAEVEGCRLERGRLAVSLVIDGLPVGDLAVGARLRVGRTAIVELGAPAVSGRSAAGAAGVFENGAGWVRLAEVLEGGLVEPGDPVTLVAVALPVTDVLDLHSFRPEDVPGVVGEYVEAARREGLAEVRIVHGRGRGVQRGAVRRLLTRTAGVAGFAEAPPARGGWGATIVRLLPAEEKPSA